MAKNQQVLLIDANPEHRARLKRLLSEQAYAVVGEAHYGIEASRLAEDLRPEILLVHIEEPLALAFRTLESVQRAAPRATPVVVSGLDNAETARKAMLAGARGYVLSSADAAELDRVLSSAHRRYRETLEMPATPANSPSAGAVITVFGPKGGVGKTTLATNLAIGLRKHTLARVAVVDLDSHFGDVAIMMGAEPEHTVAEAVAALRGGATARLESLLALLPSGVHVLAAPHAADAGPPPSPEDIATLLDRLAASFDFVVVDTPGAFGPQVAAALDEAATVLMVTSADMASIKDVRMSIAMLRDAGFDTDRLKLVVNHATNANSVSDEALARTVGYDVFWTIPHDRAVPISTQEGRPVLLSNPKAGMARRVDALAQHLSGAGSEPEAKGSRRMGPLAFLSL